VNLDPSQVVYTNASTTGIDTGSVGGTGTGASGGANALNYGMQEWASTARCSRDSPQSPNSPTKKGRTRRRLGDAPPQGQPLSLKNVNSLPSANAAVGYFDGKYSVAKSNFDNLDGHLSDIEAGLIRVSVLFGKYISADQLTQVRTAELTKQYTMAEKAATNSIQSAVRSVNDLQDQLDNLPNTDSLKAGAFTENIKPPTLQLTPLSKN